MTAPLHGRPAVNSIHTFLIARFRYNSTMRFYLLFLFTLLAALTGCKVYDPSLLDAGRGDSTVSDATDDNCNGTVCNGTCVSLQNDVHHCGACGRDCTALPGVIASAVRCIEGVCDVTGACMPGRAHCTSNPMDGCETDVTSPSRCGSCTTMCTEPTPVCSMLASDGGTAYRCTSGCQGSTPDRCAGTCVDLRTNPRHCGRCDNACTGGANGTPRCTDGTCDISCNPGFGNCDGDLANGCETDVNTSVMHCGRCDNACTGGANGTPRCTDGTCDISCNPGFGNCDGDLANGCETDVNTSVMHCGRCGNACAAPANGTVQCIAGTCRVTCNRGFVLVDGACLLPGPRLLSPLSTATVTQQRPRLRWMLAAGTDGGRVEICRDRACTVIEATIDATGSSAIPPTALSAGVHFWRVRGRSGTMVVTAPSATWQFTVGVRSATGADTAYGTVPDFDGDGFADVLVGSPGTNTAYLYRGSSGGVPTTPVRITGPMGAINFGSTVASAGDTNGDGYADAVIAAVGSTTVYVYHGGPTGLPSLPSVTIPAVGGSMGFGTSVASAGDTNGDGYADLIVGAPSSGTAYVYLGSPSGLSTTPYGTLPGPGGTSSRFGASVSSAGDVNGDSYGDVVVGAPSEGRAYLYLGQLMTGIRSSPSATLLPSGVIRMGNFGVAVAGAGDVNGDGFTEVIVGDSTNNLAYLFRGSATGVDTNAVSIIPPMGSGAMQFGQTVAAIGDVDRDGYGDLMVGAVQSAQVFVYTGSTTSPMFVRTLSGMSGSNFGAALAGAGDVNNDGYHDVLVGAPATNTVYLYRGGTMGFPSATDILMGPMGSSGFGFSVASLIPRTPSVRPRG